MTFSHSAHLFAQINCNLARCVCALLSTYWIVTQFWIYTLWNPPLGATIAYSELQIHKKFNWASKLQKKLISFKLISAHQLMKFVEKSNSKLLVK
jgi:hypothetical protein